MQRVPSWLLTLTGLLFGLFHAMLGILWIDSNDQPLFVILALVLYLMALIPSVLIFGSRRLSTFQAWFNAGVSALIPLIINSQLDPTHLTDYATWYVLGVGTLLGATAVRGRRRIAWAGLVILVAEIAAWGGVGSLATTGLPGVFSLVVTGHAVSLGVERALKAAAELNKKAADLAFDTAARETASEVRSNMFEKTLRTALPALNLIAALGGNLNEAQRREALLLEASLRDEIRGATLLTDPMREAIKAARLRGVEVLVMDEGGLENIAEAERAALLTKAAESISDVASGRLTIRSPREEEWRITLVAVRPGQSKPDLWLKLR
jgi:hypothetical protein